jgi:hypothetical protein
MKLPVLRYLILFLIGLGVAAKALQAQESIVEVAVKLPTVPDPAAGEPLPFSTERPTVGYSPDLIPAGSLQVETGVGLTARRKQYAVDGPESLIRLGVSSKLELRVTSSNMVYQNPSVPGIGVFQDQDMALSGKVLIAGPNKFLPKSAIFSVSLPTGGVGLTSGSYDPSLTLIWTQAFRKGYFLNEVPQVTWTTNQGAREATWAPSVAGGRSLTDKLSIFAEYAPGPLADRSLPYVIDGGFAYLPGKLRQIDVRTGYSKDANGYHALITIGYSVRRDGFVHAFHSSHSANVR